MIRSAIAALSAPPTIAHEMTHFAAAKAAGTDDAELAVEVLGSGAITVWKPIDRPALRAFAHLAPTIFGALLAAIWSVSGIELSGWRWILAVGLVIYAMPSEADINGALGRQTAQSEEHKNV